MTNIKDLEIEKEIVPLFDFTNHAFAREALMQLLTDRPDSVDEIITRQEIIKEFIANWDIVSKFTYSKANLHEVHGFLARSVNNSMFFHSSPAALRVNLILYSRMKPPFQAGIMQSLQLFLKLRSYFSLLKADSFPGEFAGRLKSLQQFLAAFRLDSDSKFTNNNLVETVQIIKQKSASNEIATFWENLFLFEAYFSIAKAHLKYKFCFPEFTNDRFALTGFYHPLLKAPVKNDLIHHHHVLLLTGPNMSGKSTLLKSIGLCVYLGHLGIGVPANTCAMPYFDTISIAINLKDDLKSGYSHFLSEIKTLKNVVTEAAANKRCFAVFDELFRGTNPEDALEISKTTIHGLTNFPQSVFWISTHLHQLKELIDLSSIGTHYIECQVKNNQPVFTYTLKTGWSVIKIGQLLFEQEGLNQLLNA
jgi:DNA mismatch repair protein MutS